MEIGKKNVSKQAFRRLSKEYMSFAKNAPPFLMAKPLESNILEWHYILLGPRDSPFNGGEYWGVLLFPSDYPFKPPAIKMMTPNGRFQTNMRLCLSISDYHPETWNPSWSVESILTGLLSFMLESGSATGTLSSSEHAISQLARESHGWNRAQTKFREVFSDRLAVEQIQPLGKSPLASNSKVENPGDFAASLGSDPPGGKDTSFGKFYLVGGAIILLLISFLYSVLIRVIAAL